MRNLLNFLIKYNYWLLFILLEAISMIMLIRFNNYQSSVFFTSANHISGIIYEGVNEITSYFGLHDINKDLVKRNIELELQVEELSKSLRQYTQDTAAIHRLREGALHDFRICAASVVNNSVTKSDNYITINKGSDDRIKPEMGVVSGTGVVGIVYMTSRRFSLVLPVLNTKSNISCKISRTDYFGTLKWEGGSPLYAWVKDMPRHSEFTLGDTIVTSGHSAVFPEGIPVGTVDDMEDSHDGLSYRLKVRLFTDFARLEDVNVIQSSVGTEQTQLEDSIKKAGKI